MTAVGRGPVRMPASSPRLPEPQEKGKRKKAKGRGAEFNRVHLPALILAFLLRVSDSLGFLGVSVPLKI